MNTEKLRYPIGKFKDKKEINSDDIKNWVLAIKIFPEKLINEVQNFSETEFNYKYRPKGWTIKQVIAHCLDSHINSFIRFKLTLTEEKPTIKPYAEEKWAELNDTLRYDVKENLQTLKNIHNRWVFLLESLSEKELIRTFIHPDGNEVVTLKTNIAIYAWHCDHHLQHVINAKTFKY